MLPRTAGEGRKRGGKKGKGGKKLGRRKGKEKKKKKGAGVISISLVARNLSYNTMMSQRVERGGGRWENLIGKKKKGKGSLSSASCRTAPCVASWKEEKGREGGNKKGLHGGRRGKEGRRSRAMIFPLLILIIPIHLRGVTPLGGGG